MRKFKTNEYDEVLMDRTDIKRLGGKQDGTILCSRGAGFISQENWKEHFLPLIIGLPDLVNSCFELIQSLEKGNAEQLDTSFEKLKSAIEPYEKLT